MLDVLDDAIEIACIGDTNHDRTGKASELGEGYNHGAYSCGSLQDMEERMRLLPANAEAAETKPPLPAEPLWKSDWLGALGDEIAELALLALAALFTASV